MIRRQFDCSRDVLLKIKNLCYRYIKTHQNRLVWLFHLMFYEKKTTNDLGEV